MNYTPPPQKPFAWSWSRFKNFRTCPKRSYHLDIVKDVKEEESEQLKWGNLVHNSMAAYIAKGTPLPPMVQRFHDWPDRIISMKEAGCNVLVERKLAMTKKFEPCTFFDAGAWFRAVVDVEIELPKELAAEITIDWKTGGKVEPDFEQLGLSSQVIFAHRPEINHVVAIYVWLGHDTQTVKLYSRPDMVPLWNDIMPLVHTMDVAYRTTTYPPKPSGLCRNYCPITSCPHHGKGSR